MTSFTFSPEQVRSAPPAVRQWIANEIAADLRALMEAHQEHPGHPAELAACSPDEALQVFESIRGDFATAQIFLELARAPIVNGNPSLHALGIADIMHHTRLTESRLVECFTIIDQVFQQVCKNHDATLFGFDQVGHVYINEATHRSIHILWERLIQMQPPVMAATPVASPPIGFTPPHVGPSEDIAAHVPS
ncbi:MAG TPA: hypothetical protein VMD75_03295 [Candidatus Binataceae bacterium]|nr:hypothetical protein [Candidatus Binataceae bacterium]